MLRTVVFALVLTLCLVACSTQPSPMVWLSKDFTMTNYTSFEIQPAENLTESFLQPEILHFLTVALKEEFAMKDLQLYDSQHDDNKALTVKSEIWAYKINTTPSSRRLNKTVYALCILRIHLFDKESDNFLAEIFTVNQIIFGYGLLEPKTPEEVLKKSAATVAKELAKMM